MLCPLVLLVALSLSALPADTRPGQHLGGIAAQYPRAASPLASPALAAGFGVTTVTRALTAVLLTVASGP